MEAPTTPIEDSLGQTLETHSETTTSQVSMDAEYQSGISPSDQLSVEDGVTPQADAQSPSNANFTTEQSADVKQESGTPATPTSTPILQGEWAINDYGFTWSGKWGMGTNDVIVDQIQSDFQYTKHRDNPSATDYVPESGYYSGWFDIQGAKITRVKETKVYFDFKQQDKNTYLMSGKGSNKFGPFVLRGSWNRITNKMTCTKVYQPKPAIVEKPVKPKTPSTTQKTRFQPATTSSASSPVYKSRRPQHRLATPSFLWETTDAPEYLTEEMKYCYKILERLSAHEYAGPFLEPVDPVKLNIPNYFTIINNPMDLGTIQEKLKKNEYENCNQFAQDIRLTFNNAFTFNQPDSDVYYMAKKLSELFERDFSQFKARYNDSYLDIPSPEIRPVKRTMKKQPSKRIRQTHYPVANRVATVAVSNDSLSSNEMHRMMIQIAELKEQVESIRQKLKEKETTTEEVYHFTAEEKQEIHSQIYHLDYQTQMKVFEIIQKYTPYDNNNDEIEVDLETLNDKALYEVQQYLRSVNHKTSSTQEGASPRTKQSDDGEFNESDDHSIPASESERDIM